MPKPRPFVGGNWKCNGTKASIVKLVDVLNSHEVTHAVDVVVAPTAAHLGLVQSILTNSAIQVSAQNCIPAGGAFTGEINAAQVKDLGLDWVIIGHSERRTKYGETDEVVAAKVAAAVQAGLKVIACIGETLDEREAGKTMDVVLRQMAAIDEAYSGTGKGMDWYATDLVIAYEPVWAIGTGKVATPEQAQEVHAGLRNYLGVSRADTRIIYGGSANDKNCGDLYSQADINGFLVGGASLLPAFNTIIDSTA